MKKRIGFALALSLALGLTLAACGGETGPAAASAAVSDGPEEELTVYDCGGLSVGLPTKYVDQLLVETDPAKLENGELIQVYEKASVEADMAEFGTERASSNGMGYLFSISRGNRADCERNLMYNIGGKLAFARDGETYYFLDTPTDVRFFRQGLGVSSDSPDWAAWAELGDTLPDAAMADFVARNELEPWSDAEFYQREYTYDSPHAFVRHDTYFDFDGSRDQYSQLILSQPAKQGEGGIWCVERFYDETGTVYHAFPDTGVSAADYYAQVQAKYDGGEAVPEATVLGAARAYVAQNWSSTAQSAEGFSVIDEVDWDYIKQNQAVLEMASDLLPYDWNKGNAPKPMELLECMGDMEPENWGVLGRRMYGSDWWTPLEAALLDAAVGENQAKRDGETLDCFLSYAARDKTDGLIYEGLCGILQAQYTADEAAFDRALAELDASERAQIPDLLVICGLPTAPQRAET